MCTDACRYTHSRNPKPKRASQICGRAVPVRPFVNPTLNRFEAPNACQVIAYLTPESKPLLFGPRYDSMRRGLVDQG